MKWTRLIPAFALALAAAGCQAGSSRDQTAIYPSTDPIVTDVIRRNTAVATDLFAHLRQIPGNLFFSPISISTALAMTFTKGVYGAAAAEVDFKKSPEPSRRELNRTFCADHPLLVPLRDRATSSILSMGHVVDPVA